MFLKKWPWESKVGECSHSESFFDQRKGHKKQSSKVPPFVFEVLILEFIFKKSVAVTVTFFCQWLRICLLGDFGDGPPWDENIICRRNLFGLIFPTITANRGLMKCLITVNPDEQSPSRAVAVSNQSPAHLREVSPSRLVCFQFLVVLCCKHLRTYQVYHSRSLQFFSTNSV